MVDQRPGAITFAGTTGAPTKSTLPPDLLQQAASRLGLVSLIYAITYGAAFYPGEIMFRLEDRRGAPNALGITHEEIFATVAADSAIMKITSPRISLASRFTLGKMS